MNKESKIMKKEFSENFIREDVNIETELLPSAIKVEIVENVDAKLLNDSSYYLG